jgi:hypothetical protein
LRWVARSDPLSGSARRPCGRRGSPGRVIACATGGSCHRCQRAGLAAGRPGCLAHHPALWSCRAWESDSSPGGVLGHPRAGRAGGEAAWLVFPACASDHGAKLRCRQLIRSVFSNKNNGLCGFCLFCCSPGVRAFSPGRRWRWRLWSSAWPSARVWRWRLGHRLGRRPGSGAGGSGHRPGRRPGPALAPLAIGSAVGPRLALAALVIGPARPRSGAGASCIGRRPGPGLALAPLVIGPARPGSGAGASCFGRRPGPGLALEPRPERGADLVAGPPWPGTYAGGVGALTL